MRSSMRRCLPLLAFVVAAAAPIALVLAADNIVSGARPRVQPIQLDSAAAPNAPAEPGPAPTAPGTTATTAPESTSTTTPAPSTTATTSPFATTVPPPTVTAPGVTTATAPPPAPIAADDDVADDNEGPGNAEDP